MGQKIYWFIPVLLVAALAIIKGLSSDDEQISTFQERPVAPDFVLRDLQGKPVRLADFSGQVRIVNFWATWCGPCWMEIPHLQELYDKYRAQGVMVIGISLDQGGSQVVQPFVEEVGITYPVALGDRQTTQAYGGVSAIPTSFIVDRKGRIYRIYMGYRDKAEFEAAIQALLHESAATRQPTGGVLWRG
ncbi:MAG: TlpA family protein disulfide reductase [Candidatus Latescibacteria bacterium]|nr:TlpA family protein disulfide reductase [Candidatus Latescibacterota bacterium]